MRVYKLLSVIISLLGLGLTVSAASAEDPVIECTAFLGDKKITLIVNNKSVSLQSPAGPTKEFKITKRRVMGAGDFARTLVEFHGGKLVYKNTYGRMSDIQLTLTENKNEKITYAECHEREEAQVEN
jgi:hypothetical protein